ncbi:tetratricopeptide repeat protein [Antarcticimicrobium luteum]|uniref:Tetratricopeptide repeat protein n=1 Tax=Antarcticimicrobium luteum TaxID=2547397 RepID=A0A4R5VGN7_9RHOB|nr:tetratricopeptide repeat protein [Antarcticimicrobium luteum]TDK52641.1 tetratricopeptide repeat protein [Antarcticimicrobium luteum]
MRVALTFAVLVARPLLADCPPPPDHSAALAGLMALVQAAETETEAREIGNRMWVFWADAPDDQAQAILDRGMTRRAGYDFLGAIREFDTLIAYCPDYAEGYNQRAFVHYLRQDFTAALADLDRALARSPDHIAALSGRALSLYALGRIEEARGSLARALALNPWLPERGLAAPGGPLAPQGEDI